MAPTILVTGVTGGLGASVLATLLNLVPVSTLAASSSNPSAAKVKVKEGVEVRLAQYDDLDSLRLAFEGIEKLFFVSSNTFDSVKRTKQHRNVLQAAKETKVQHVRMRLPISHFYLLAKGYRRFSTAR